MKKIILFVIFAVIVAMVFTPRQASAQFLFMPNAQIGNQVEDFTLEQLSGGEASLEEVRAGRNTVVFFWATWCPHCREALKVLNNKKAEFEEKEINVVLVDVGESRQIVSKYMVNNKIDMDVFIDEESVVSDSYGLVGLPTFYIVNAQGIIKDVVHSLPDDLEGVFSRN